ncbi:two-component system regulatory protein YycI [Salinithrix halophila]|uniref:Two-component system regulatory protein YycI n=1 Tax=Salinithrix halophila TaxID=1485204 RepID=A0ABV8JE97_9BACL
MDWSKAKTILILAFLALNLFLVYQLLQARTEQNRDGQTSNTREELNQLAEERQIILKAKVPEETSQPQVNYLQVRPIKFHEPWKLNPDGTWTRAFNPPVTASGDRKKILSRYVDKVDRYVLQPDESTRERQVYYQQWDKRPLFDGRLVAEWKGRDRLAAIHQSRFKVTSQKSSTERVGVTATTALMSLIEKELISKGDTVLDIRLGYHGQSYDGNVRVLSPVWRIRTKHQTFYVNAFNGGIESSKSENQR